MERWMDYGEKMLDKVGGGRVLNKEIKNVKFSFSCIFSLNPSLDILSFRSLLSFS